MASGVKVDPKCVEAWESMKIRKASKYILFKIQNYEEIVVDLLGTGDYAEFQSKLPKKECRFACVDVACEGKAGLARSKLVFFMWAPDDAAVKDKMVYASSKDALTKKLDGIAKVLQASEPAEVAFDVVQSQIQ